MTIPHLSGFPSIRRFGAVFLLALWSGATTPGFSQALSVHTVDAYDGYAIDNNGDEAGDVKIIGSKVNALPIGETGVDSNEARVWLPFVLSEVEKAAALEEGATTTLSIYLEELSAADGLQVSIHGAGYRNSYRVNQRDYATLTKELVPAAITQDSPMGQHIFDVTEFVREEAARPDGAGVGFGFLLRVENETELPNADGHKNAFLIGSSNRDNPDEIAHLEIGSLAPVVNPVDPDPADPAAVRILILGNSILHNSPLPDIGWSGNWGMAARAPEADVAHILMSRIESTIGRPVIFKLHNIAYWENLWSDIRHDIPIVTYARDFDPDIILSCISENTGLHDYQIADYKEKYRDMIDIMSGGDSAVDVIVRGSFWTINGNTDIALSEVATEEGYPYVRCDMLSTRENQAWEADYYLGPDPVADSVLNHPNDTGMLAIADKIWGEALEELLLEKYRPTAQTSGYYEWDSIFGSEDDIVLIGPDGDFDDDGRSNFAEYAFSGDPSSGVHSVLAEVDLEEGKARFRFRLRADDSELTYQVAWSRNLNSWSYAGLDFVTGSWVLDDDAPFSVQSNYDSDAWVVSLTAMPSPYGEPLFVRGLASGVE